jgi:hypothetical protein
MRNDLALATVSLPSGNSNYYLTVFALTPKGTPVDVGTQQQAGQAGTPIPTASPLLIFTPFIIFFCLFIAAFGILTMNRIRNFRQSVTSLVIALLVAGIPYVLGVVRSGVGFEPKAGPDEIPRNIRILKQSVNSIMVMWDTDEQQLGAVRYSLPPLTVPTAIVIIEGNDAKVQHHTVTINKLKPGPYELEIFSGTRWYDENGIPLKFTVSKK